MMTEYFSLDAFSVQFQYSVGCVLIKAAEEEVDSFETGQMEIPKPARMSRTTTSAVDQLKTTLYFSSTFANLNLTLLLSAGHFWPIFGKK